MAERLGEAAVSEFVRVLIGTIGEAPFLCEDCEQPTDLGRKCRACYAAWSRLLWQDIPAELARLHAVARMFRALPEAMQLAVAEVHAGRGRRSLSGEAAEVYAACRPVLAGPFSDSLDGILRGPFTKPAKTARAEREALS